MTQTLTRSDIDDLLERAWEGTDRPYSLLLPPRYRLEVTETSVPDHYIGPFGVVRVIYDPFVDEPTVLPRLSVP